MENENQVIDMKKEIQIRKMKKSDLPQLQEMYRDLIPEGVSMEVLENNYYRTVDRPEYFLAVAADGDKVLGSTMGIVCIALDAPFLVVENVIVSGECRGQGVGRKYLRHWMNLHLKISVNMHFWFLPDSEREHTGFMRRLAIQMMYAGFENIIRKL